jgi:hypothetical protein
VLSFSVDKLCTAVVADGGSAAGLPQVQNEPSWQTRMPQHLEPSPQVPHPLQGPQSDAQVAHVSPPLQTPSPHGGGGGGPQLKSAELGWGQASLQVK